MWLLLHIQVYSKIILDFHFHNLLSLLMSLSSGWKSSDLCLPNLYKHIPRLDWKELIVEEWWWETCLFEASQQKSKALTLCVKHMGSTWLSFPLYPLFCLLLAGVWIGGICSDDGPKQSSSLLWTLVMWIRCFLLQWCPIKANGPVYF